MTMGEVYRLKILEVAIKERTDLDFRDRVKILERLHAAEINCTEFSVIMKGGHCVAPPRCEFIYRGLPSLLSLRSNLQGKVNQRWNSDHDRGQLTERCQHFPVHNCHLILGLARKPEHTIASRDTA